MPIDERERERRRNLVRAHYKAENNHDLEGIMKTFSPDAVMLYNRREFPSDDTIRWAHGYIGMTASGEKVFMIPSRSWLFSAL